MQGRCRKERSPLQVRLGILKRGRSNSQHTDLTWPFRFSTRSLALQPARVSTADRLPSGLRDEFTAPSLVPKSGSGKRKIQLGRYVITERAGRLLPSARSPGTSFRDGVFERLQHPEGKTQGAGPREEEGRT